MRSPIKILLIGLIAWANFGCSNQPQAESFEDFANCWGFERRQSELYETNFRAIVYPTHGVIAYAERCPALRLAMIFNNTQYPPGFNAFELADQRRPQVVGIAGRAIIAISSQQDPNVLTVDVRRLIQGDILDKEETRRLAATMSSMGGDGP